MLLTSLILSLFLLGACSGGGGSSFPVAGPSNRSSAPTAAARTTESPAPVASQSPAAASPSPAPTASQVAIVSGSSPLPAVSAAAADSFVNSIGVDTHFNYNGTPYTTNFSTIAAALVASGIRHVRDGVVDDNFPQNLAYLGQNGIKHGVAFPVTTTAEQIISTIAGYAPYVEYVEPQNEYDLSGDPNWAAEIVNEQHLLESTLRANSAYAGISVLGPSFGNLTDAAFVGPLDPYEDFGNLHNYPCNFNPGTTNSVGIAAATALLRASTQTKPIWTTEVGYADNLVQWSCALTDAVIAKYDPRTVAERWLAGEPRTYFYQFADMSPEQNYNSMGLVTMAGTTKPQYTALQSMIALLSDPGSTFQAAALPYALGGNTANVQQLLLEKRDGTYFLMLWLEVPSWNPAFGIPANVSPQTISLTLPRAPASATQYSYTSSWTLQSATLSSSTTIPISVSDAITFVHLQF
jgi:hypothetical protein